MYRSSMATSMRLTVPLFEPAFGAAEVEAVTAPVREGWITMGPRTEEFETHFAAATGARHVVAVNSCTAALHLALVACRIGPGDEVLCPTLTFVATANAIRYVGATPIFCESAGPSNLNIDPDDVETKLTPRTRAVIAVHYAGYPADLPRLKALCDDRGLSLVEDAAHACISDLGGRACGTWGRLGCFSFFANKNITCGEGGAICTDDDELAVRLRLLRAHGMTTSTLDRHRGLAHSYDVVDLGYNYRLDEIRAGLVQAQLARLGDFAAQRRRLVDRYRQDLAPTSLEIPDFDWPRLSSPGDRLTPHIFPVLLPAGLDRRQIISELRSLGIQTSIHYPPVHRFQSFMAAGSRETLPRTEALAERELTLPLFPSMSDEQLIYVCTQLRSIIERHGQSVTNNLIQS